MKKILFAVTMLVALVIAGSAFGFSSTGSYSFGKGDKEYTMAVSGQAITVGQWVVIADSAVVADRECETASVVVLTSTENAGPCLGVATASVDTGVLFTVQTRGWCDYAKVDGVDSASAQTGLTNLPVRTSLAITARSGYAGAAAGLLTTVSAAPVGTQIVGFLLEPVTGRANSAAFADTNTSYAVYVTAR